MNIIDVHVYYGKWNFAIPFKSIGQILDEMNRRGVEKAILMSSRSILGDFCKGNEELFEVIGGHPQLYGYCYINGHYPEESLAQMRRYLPFENCKGIKFHPEYSAKRPDGDDVFRLFETLAFDYGKPALIHSWPLGEHGNPTPYSHPQFIANLAAKLPNLNIVMGHMGGPQWKEAVEIAKPFGNLYLDTGSSYTHAAKVKVAVETLGADRVLFGSGWTEGNLDMQLGVVLDAPISQQQRQVVLYEAARRLFQL